MGLKNHQSTTMTHVCFITKMSKSTRKAEVKNKLTQDKSSGNDKFHSTISNLENEIAS